MKILVLGSQGQLGSCLSNQLASSSYQVVYVTRSEIDVADLAKTEAKIAEIGPNILINACAYTAVDNAEKEKEAAYLYILQSVIILQQAVLPYKKMTF